MGYHLTTSPENAVPAKSRGMPKTHTPGSPVKERGARFYMPENGRWPSRDPIGELGGANVYVFVRNSASDHIDALGHVIVSFEVKGGQGETGWWDGSHGGNYWFRSVPEPFKNVFSGPNTGFYMKKEPAIGNGIFGVSLYEVVGGWKFEEKALWCGNNRYPPEFKNYASNVHIITHDFSDSSNESSNNVAQFRDGPRLQYDGTEHDAPPKEDNNYVALAVDAPRLQGSYHNPKTKRYYLTGDWLLTVEDRRSKWEAKMHISFAFDNDLNSASQVGHFIVTSPPRRVR